MTSLLEILAPVLLVAGLAVAAYVATTPDGLLRGVVRRYLSWLSTQLTALHASTPAWQVFAAQVGGAVFLVVVGAAHEGYYALAAPLPFAFTAPVLRAARVRRAAAIERQLAGWLVAMANLLKVSGSISDALAQSLEHTQPPLADELDRTVKEIRVGAPVDTALDDLAVRVHSAVLTAAVTTLVIGRRAGGALPALLDQSAVVSRERLRLDRVFRQHLVSVRLQFYVLALGPPVLVGALARTHRGYFDPLLDSNVSGLVLITAGGLWAIAVLVARRVMSSVL